MSLPSGASPWMAFLAGSKVKIQQMLQAILNKSWRQHPTKQQLYGLLLPITKTIKVWRTRHTEYCWRSWDELVSDVLLWNPSHGRAKVGGPTRTYIRQLCANTGYSLEDLLEAMDDREWWREKVMDIRADDAKWWWWYHYQVSLLARISLTLSLSLSLSPHPSLSSITPGDSSKLHPVSAQSCCK